MDLRPLHVHMYMCLSMYMHMYPVKQYPEPYGLSPDRSLPRLSYLSASATVTLLRFLCSFFLYGFPSG